MGGVQECLFAGEMVLGRTHLFKKGLHSGRQNMKQGLSRGRSIVNKGMTLKNQGCGSVNTCLTEPMQSALHLPNKLGEGGVTSLFVLSCLDFKGGVLSNASLNVFFHFSLLILNNKIPFYLLSWLY